MKTKILLLFILALLTFNIYTVVAADENTNQNNTAVQKFNEAVKKYDREGITSSVRPDNLPRTDNSLLKVIPKKLIKILFAELHETAPVFTAIICVSILAAVLKSFTSNETIAEVGFYACFAVCASLIAVSFQKCTAICINAISDITDFMDLSIPTYAAVLASGGYGISAGSVQGIFIVISELITHFIKAFMIPLLYCCGLLSIVNGISSSLQLNKLIKLISKFSKYAIGFAMTAFVGILSFTGFSTSAQDGLAVKTAKYAVSSFVPVVGGCLSDTLNSVVYSSVILKNTMGSIGFVIIVILCITPVLKTFIIIFIFKFCAAASTILSDNKMECMLDTVSDVLVTIAGLLIVISVIFILILGIISAIGV